MKKLFVLVLVLCTIGSFVFSGAAAQDLGDVVFTHISRSVIDKEANALVSNSIMKADYDYLFDGKTAAQAVLEIAASGNFYFNGTPLPYRLEDGSFSAESLAYPTAADGSGEAVFALLDSGNWTWNVHTPCFKDDEGTGLPYDEALVKVIEGFSHLNGFAIEFIAEPGSSEITKISMVEKSCSVVDSITENEDGTVTVAFISEEEENADGKVVTSATNEITVPASNLKGFSELKPGDLALYWWMKNGDVFVPFIERGYPTLGKLTGEVKYNIDGDDKEEVMENMFNGTAYEQALMPRPMPARYRNFQFMIQHCPEVMGFLNNDDRTGELVVMWSTEYGTPFGYTYADPDTEANVVVMNFGGGPGGGPNGGQGGEQHP